LTGLMLNMGRIKNQVHPPTLIYACTMLVLIVCSISVWGQHLHPVMNSFKQGEVEEGGGNCASIALIKASIATFGVGKVLTTLHKGAGQYTYQLRDGSTVTLTDAEIMQVIASAGFEQFNKDQESVNIKRYADTCFAVMCKRAQQINNLPFDSAILDLNNGHNMRKNDPPLQSYLGVAMKRIEPHRASKISKQSNLIVYNYYHAAYATQGTYDECWNNISGVNKLNRFKWKRWGIKCSYKMCGLSGAFKLIYN
jgi:hypothetical protein